MKSTNRGRGVQLGTDRRPGPNILTTQQSDRDEWDGMPPDKREKSRLYFFQFPHVSSAVRGVIVALRNVCGTLSRRLLTGV